jgi:GTP-binding protein
MRRDGRTVQPGAVKAGAKRPAGAVAPNPLDAIDAEFLAEARDPAQLPPPSVPEIAVAGRSNVGKSTLLNAICQRKGLARTSRTPGCTRGVVMFHLRLRGGSELRLVDLPGYGYADRSHSERRSWAGLIEKYLSKRTTLRGVLILVDARRGPEHEEQELARYLGVHGVPYALVATKIDKLSKSERVVVLRSLERDAGVRVIGVSGETGEGREQLMRALVHLARPEPEPAGEPAAPSGPDMG